MVVNIHQHVKYITIWTGMSYCRLANLLSMNSTEILAAYADAL